jgi:S-formylglutathione hydrolase FrmB
LAAVVSFGLAFANVPAAAAAPSDPGALTLVSTTRIDARTYDLVFHTADLDADSPVRVVLPDGYAASPTQHYPVVYLLHGCCDNYTSWWNLGAETLTAGMPVIVVMPDGGPGGFYSDWYNLGRGGPPRWEDYHVGHLIPWIDGHLRTVASRSGRAIAGLSMGGFALSYAARHPDLFVAGAAFSGAVDTNYLPAGQVDGAISALDFPAVPDQVWGDRASSEVVWRAHNPWDLAENLAGMQLTLRTGNGDTGGPYNQGCCPDAIEMLVHQQSLDLHEQLLTLGIPHVWDDYGPGCHCGAYWTRDLKETLPSFLATFANPPPAPIPFNYLSAEPAYSVYGWSVTMQRPAQEFSELSQVRPSGFQLAGSGSATVLTAAWYRPGQRYRVTIDGVPSTLRADGFGRLRLALPLGPGNQFQEYTAAGDAAGTRVYVATVTVSGPGVR